jgi:hypothetical protein
MIFILFIHVHKFTFRPLCLHSITKILRNGPRAHFPFTLIREGWSRRRTGRRASPSLSPTRTLVTPYCKRTRPGRGATRRPRDSPLPVLFPPSCSVSRRLIWAGTRGDNLLVGPGTPRGRNADTNIQQLHVQ